MRAGAAAASTWRSAAGPPRRRHGRRRRSCSAEGGPHLNGALLDGECVDELDLTISPVLVGGDGARVTTGARPTFEPLDLAHLATEDGYLYGRWVRRR